MRREAEGNRRRVKEYAERITYMEEQLEEYENNNMERGMKEKGAKRSVKKKRKEGEGLKMMKN